MDNPTTMNEPVKCGRCGKLCRRKHTSAPGDMPPVFSRTLLGDEFLPSCSEGCNAVLRMRIGDHKAKRKAS